MQELRATTISHYRLIEKIGEGSMGVVYRAEDLNLRRTVALKFLRHTLFADDEESARFLREAQAAATLNHPAIATVYEFDEAEDQAFIAMAFIEGSSLAERIHAGPLPLAQALPIAIQIAEGLQAAHAAGIVHRDLKAANIRLTPAGDVKIMDFGVAKLSDRSRLTQPGTRLGTEAYMAPEQILGRAVDQRADIWSLGVILYEMLTGVLPFSGEAEQELLYSILNEQPEPLSKRLQGCPPQLEQILQQALAKRPAERYTRIGEMLAALRALRNGVAEIRSEPPPARVTGPRRRAAQLALGLLALVLVVTAAWMARRWQRPGTAPALTADEIAASRQPAGADYRMAVLPFRTLSANSDLGEIADSLLDALTAALSRRHPLHVIGRAPVMPFKNSLKSTKEIGADLGVRHILEGSMISVGGKLRIIVNFVDVDSQAYLWSHIYDADRHELGWVQRDIILRVLAALPAAPARSNPYQQ